MSDLDKVGEDKPLHNTAVSPVHGNSIVDMEKKMREQIRILQEQRAAVMMNEVIELQRERDLALGRVKTLKNTIQDLTMENNFLKGTLGKGDMTEKVLFLRRSYVEEQFLSNDLHKKLQAAHKQNSALTLKVKKLEMDLATNQMLKIVNTEGNTLNGEHSNSLSNLDHRERTGDSPKTTSSPDSNVKVGIIPPVTSNRLDFEIEMKSEVSLKRKLSPTNLLVSSSQLSPSVITRSGSTTPPTYSPTVIPRRYKLAAAACRDAGTQTVPIFLQTPDANKEYRQTEVSQEVSSDVLNILEIAKKDIIKLQMEKEQLESELLDERSQRQRDRGKLHGLKKELALLKAECLVLKEGLSEFSLWIRQKMQLMEEDMDIFKVVYSLHGSLSQEKVMLNDLREKLTKAELKIQKLNSANSQLMEEVSQTEDKYKQCKKDLKHLREKTFSSSPNFSSTRSPTFSSTPPYYMSPSRQRHNTGAGNVTPILHSYKSGGGHSLEASSSPLLTRTSPPLKAMFPVRVAYESKDKGQDIV